jgi:hypothetical protein
VVAPSETLRPHADRLARLLADARGAEILAAMQELLARLHDVAGRPGLAEFSPPAPADGRAVGVWRAERTAGGVALHRTEAADDGACHWAGVDYVPAPAGARRVVVIGESLARGGSYEPLYTPTGALARRLDRAAPGAYQCVDLAKAGATVEALTHLAGQLPVVEPDILVVIAGNNWARTNVAREDGVSDDGLSAALAESLCDGGYAAMRRTFIDRAVLPRARRCLDSLLALHAAQGTQIVVVVPEFNLRGWAAPADVEVPVLAPEPLARWYELRARAERGCAAADWPDVRAAAGEMSRLDGGTSPVPGQLLARAGMADGDGAAARAGLEASRDALAGLGLPWCTPRIISEVADLLTGFAHEHGFRCVDLRAVLASQDELGLPDQRFFHDYCHLTDEGMELMMSAVADAIAGDPPGTTPAGPGIAPGFRSLMHLTAAAHSAYCGQPVENVDRYLRAAVGADPQVTGFLSGLLEVIEGADPRWTHSAIESLAAMQHVAGALAPFMLRRDVPHTMWALRAALWDVLGRTPSAAGTEIDLLASRWPTPDQPYQQCTGERQPLGFALHQPRAGMAGLTYRMPHAPAGSAAQVSLNGERLGTLAASRSWAQARFELPAPLTRTGMNWLRIHWPVPVIDTGPRHAADAAVLGRDEFPDVLPVFGELFDARVTLTCGAA